MFTDLRSLEEPNRCRKRGPAELKNSPQLTASQTAAPEEKKKTYCHCIQSALMPGKDERTAPAGDKGKGKETTPARENDAKKNVKDEKASAKGKKDEVQPEEGKLFCCCLWHRD